MVYKILETMYYACQRGWHGWCGQCGYVGGVSVIQQENSLIIGTQKRVTTTSSKQILITETTERKIIEEKSAPSNICINGNHKMGLVDQLSNLSLEEDEIQTHEILLAKNKERGLDDKLKVKKQKRL